MGRYIFVTFSPVQSFIEKTRKLRDLYGASLILSHLSSCLIEAAQQAGASVLSPGLPEIPKGMPNRILLQGNFSEEDARSALTEAWGNILYECRNWLEHRIADDYRARLNLQDGEGYPWEREWDKWKNYTWELFWGTGETPDAARRDLETRKLSRGWTAINWLGESSSISGSDAIAYPRMEAKDIRLSHSGFPAREINLAKEYYRDLAILFDRTEIDWRRDTENAIIEGKFIAENEQLSVPELVKRLVTYYPIAKLIGIPSPRGFKDIVRRASNFGRYLDERAEVDAEVQVEGHWTGWFMGDGDRFGDHLTRLASDPDETRLEQFSCIVRQWGLNFSNTFPRHLGRTIYAGGDDFLGIIYSGNPREPILGHQAFDQLIQIHESWQKMQTQLSPLVGGEVTLSVGLVWVGAGVPQRDVLQHCREAEKRSKQLGRDRVTIRVVFNNGQYVQWTTPWQYLIMLNCYKDLDGGSNWSQIYQDLATLKYRHTFGLGISKLEQFDSQFENQQLQDFRRGILEFLDLYFPGYQQIIRDNQLHIFEYVNSQPDRDRETIGWIEDLICVGWQLLGDRNSQEDDRNNKRR